MTTVADNDDAMTEREEQLERLTKRYDRLCRRMENMRLDITDLEQAIDEAKVEPVKLPGME